MQQMMRLSAEILRGYDSSDLSRSVSFAYLSAFILVIVCALYTNAPCLFFDWDGTAWAVVMDYFRQFASPFSIAMVDPLQGMFDIY
jgi:hypothetical protein